MEDNKKFELNDDMLDNVAGGRDGWAGGPEVVPSQQYVQTQDYACSKCGGHEFVVVDYRNGDSHYNGNCVNCGTYNPRVCAIVDAQIFLR